MKRITLLSTIAILMMGLMLSSCLKGDDNSNDYDKKWQDWVQNIQTEIAASVGTYDGYLYSQSDTANKMDSIAATWRVSNDSIMDMLSVPTALLVKGLPETQKTLQEAISNAGNVNIQVHLLYNYYYSSPLQILVYPDPVTFNVNYGDAVRQVTITFSNSETNTASLAQYMMKDGSTYVHKSLVELIPQSVSLDGKTQYSFSSDAYLIWYGSKKQQ